MTRNPYEAELVSVEEALERILSHFARLNDECRSLIEARGQVLAADIRAAFDVPPANNSAMDGYAVRARDVASASAGRPVKLPVIGMVAAGETPRCAVSSGTAVRIMTGAPMPSGADAVVPFEDTDEVDRHGGRRDSIGIRAAITAGTNVRLAGEDIRRGSVVVAKGTAMGPAEMGVAASLGLAAVRVIRRPVVAIVSTGDELLSPGEPLVPGKIYDSNAFAIAGLVQRYGGIPRLVGRAGDSTGALNDVLDRAVESDMVVTSAGVSRGDYDVVKDVLAARGRIALSLVRMRPAKPLAFGTLRSPDGRDVPHLGLPGNPASAMVAFELFGRPAIHVMMGRSDSETPLVQAVLDDPIQNPDRRRVFARVVVYRSDGGDGYRARLAGSQGSGVLTTMALANGLAICPEDVPVLERGEVAKVRLLDWKD
jgi:molybdopterin molybdotransferase